MASEPPANQATRKRKNRQPPPPHPAATTKTLISKKSEAKKKHKNKAPKNSNPNANSPGEEKSSNKNEEAGGGGDGVLVSSTLPAARQLEFFLGCFQKASKMRLSPLELEAYNESSMVELAEGVDQNVENIGDHMKAAFGTSWREALSEGKFPGDGVDAGSPALLIISTSALRSLEVLRGLKAFTRECHPVKLFAKHLKVEEQVTLLKTRVNIACGTPSRIKKLIDIDALSLSRLEIVMLDMQRDAKSYSLFTIPQVSEEFWDLYKSHLDEKVRQGSPRLCFYGAISEKEISKVLPSIE